VQTSETQRRFEKGVMEIIGDIRQTGRVTCAKKPKGGAALGGGKYSSVTLREQGGGRKEMARRGWGRSRVGGLRANKKYMEKKRPAGCLLSAG